MSDGEATPQEAGDPSDLAEDHAALTEQAERLRRSGRHAAADQLLAWRDLHLLRHGGKG